MPSFLGASIFRTDLNNVVAGADFLSAPVFCQRRRVIRRLRMDALVRSWAITPLKSCLTHFLMPYSRLEVYPFADATRARLRPTASAVPALRSSLPFLGVQLVLAICEKFSTKKRTDFAASGLKISRILLTPNGSPGGPFCGIMKAENIQQNREGCGQNGESTNAENWHNTPAGDKSLHCHREGCLHPRVAKHHKRPHSRGGGFRGNGSVNLQFRSAVATAEPGMTR